MKKWWCGIRGALDWAGRACRATATVFALVGLVTSAFAAVVNVTSVAALQTAINRAVAGDVLDRHSLDDLVQNKRVLMQLIPEPAL